MIIWLGAKYRRRKETNYCDDILPSYQIRHRKSEYHMCIMAVCLISFDLLWFKRVRGAYSATAITFLLDIALPGGIATVRLWLLLCIRRHRYQQFRCNSLAYHTLRLQKHLYKALSYS